MRSHAVLKAIVSAAVMVLLSGCGDTTQPAKEISVDLGGGAKMKFVKIEPGEFMMGSPAGEKDRSGDEGPQHKVRITKAFYVGVHEVTRGQFAAFVQDAGYKTEAEKEGWSYAWDGKTWSKVNGASWKAPGFEQKDDHPVVCVSWNDAVAFCEWASKKTKGTVRLPTEAEWEFACRGGTTTAYQWGDDPDKGQGWCNGADLTAKDQFKDWAVFNWRDGFVYTAPVGSFKGNAWDLYDMHGNVWEWCADWHADKYEGGQQTDPTGPANGTFRVLRGGAWVDYPWSCRSALRGRETPVSRNDYCGFRCVRTVLTP